METRGGRGLSSPQVATSSFNGGSPYREPPKLHSPRDVRTPFMLQHKLRRVAYFTLRSLQETLSTLCCARKWPLSNSDGRWNGMVFWTWSSWASRFRGLKRSSGHRKPGRSCRATEKMEQWKCTSGVWRSRMIPFKD